MSLSKNKIKYIRSLNEKKYRTEHGTFVAEGKKLVFDLLGNCRCQFLAGSPEVMSEISSLSAEEIVDSTPDELKKASQLKTAPQVIGVFYKPKHDVEDIELSNKLHLVLDGIQDRKYGNHCKVGRLVWNRTYFLFTRYRRYLQSKNRTSNNGSHCTSESALFEYF